jgi:hypothetical protein
MELKELFVMTPEQALARGGKPAIDPVLGRRFDTIEAEKEFREKRCKRLIQQAKDEGFLKGITVKHLQDRRLRGEISHKLALFYTKGDEREILTHIMNLLPLPDGEATREIKTRARDILLIIRQGDKTWTFAFPKRRIQMVH